MTLTISPSQAQPGDVIHDWSTPDPEIRSVESWSEDEFVKITFRDGGVLNTYGYRQITVERREERRS